MMQGWQCPGGHQCYAPGVWKCPTCQSLVGTNTTEPIFLIDGVPCPHSEIEQRTDGKYCKTCGSRTL